MNDRLRRALSNATDLTLDVPVARVLARGDLLRRRRHRGLALGASGVIAVTVLSVAVTVGQPEPHRSGDDAAPDLPRTVQVAAWTGPTTNLSAEQLADVGAACAASSDETRAADHNERGWGLPGTMAPVAAELRDDVVLTYYRQGRDYATCALRDTPDGGFQVLAQSAGVEKPLPSGQPMQFVTSGAADAGSSGGKLSRIYAVVRTSAAVASLEIRVGGASYRSAVERLGLFWLPDGKLTPGDLAQATVTARDADGDILHRSGRGELW